MPLRRLVTAATAAVLVIAGLLASTAPDASSVPAARTVPITPATGLRAGLMPTRAQAHRAQAALGAQATAASLSYNGGPVLPNAQVQAVWWGSGTFLGSTDSSTTMTSFLGHLMDSSYLAWLDEYRTPSPANGGTGQSIDYGTYLGAAPITPASSATTVSDTTIQSELLTQITSGALPAPTNDGQGNSETVYAIFFPAGTTVCQGTDCSGTVFCAYHSTTSNTVDGLHVPYMVLPDAHAMGSGCGNGTDAQNEMSYTSHELVETMTDPLVGLNTLSWYDQQNGEIGDICNGLDTTLDSSYTVQQEWSNAANACIATKTQPGSPTGFTAAPAPGGAVTLSWSVPSSNGGTALSEYDVYRTTVPGRQGATVARVPAGTTTWTSGALTNGTTYRFEVAARNAGAVSSPDTAQVPVTADSQAPSVSLTSPTAAFQLSRSVHVGYTATDAGSGVAGYDVQQESAAWNGGFGAWSSVATGTTATSVTITGSPGHEYCVRVRAHDHAGNVSGWSAVRCTTLPLDDRALAAATTGWTRASDSAAYRGTLSRTTKKGSRLQLVGARVARVALVVQTCSGCGKVGIYLGGTLWKTVDTAAAATHEKVLLLPGSFRLRTTTITLKAMSSAKKVAIDGLGVARG